MVRFQADADLDQIIVAALVRKNPLVDFRTAAVASLEGLRDGDVLALAAADKRILVTHDAKTMPRRSRCSSPRPPLEMKQVRVDFLVRPPALVRRRETLLGVRSVDRSGRTLRVTGPERTLVEGFRSPRRVGGFAELVAASAGFPVLDLALLESRRPRSRVYLARGEGPGRLASRWNLMLPDSLTSSERGLVPTLRGLIRTWAVQSAGDTSGRQGGAPGRCPVAGREGQCKRKR